MNLNLQPVTVNILGKEYKIACDPNEREELLRSAQALDEQMRKIRDSGKVNGTDRIAVMAALNIAHELCVFKNENAVLRKKLNESLANMSKKIENVLENQETR
jgi:cell division protein ZapA